MKKLTLFLLFQWAFFAFSQTETDWTKITFKEAAFFGTLNTEEQVVQKDKTGNLSRILTPFEKKSPEEHFRYLLNCYNKEGVVEESQYILSKIGIPKDFDLFRIRCNSAEVLCYDYFADKNFNVDGKRGVKMIVKIKDEEVGLNNPMASYYQPCGNGGFSVCEDWYLVEYYVDNGEIISITPWGTTCSGCVGGALPEGGGGGGGGNPAPPEPVTCSSDNGSPVSIHESTSYSSGDAIRYSSHQWTFFQRTGLRIHSFEKGTQHSEGIGEKTKWYFDALDHISTNQTGADTEFDISHTISSAVGTPEGDPQYARMYLHYKIDYKCKRNPSVSFSNNLESDATWRVNGQGEPWIFGPTVVQ